MFTQNQLTPVNRHIANISTHKILSVTESSRCGRTLTVGCTGRIKGGRLEINVSEEHSDLKPGVWVDLIVETRSIHGTLSSYSVKYIGQTPDRFIPTDTNKTWG